MACKVSRLGNFKCSKCASCSGLALRGWTRPDEVLPVHGAEAISTALADVHPRVMLHTTRHLVGSISALRDQEEDQGFNMGLSPPDDKQLYTDRVRRG